MSGGHFSSSMKTLMIVLACVPPVLQDGEEYHCEWSLTLNYSFSPQKGISQRLYVPSQQRDELECISIHPNTMHCSPNHHTNILLCVDDHVSKHNEEDRSSTILTWNV